MLDVDDATLARLDGFAASLGTADSAKVVALPVRPGGTNRAKRSNFRAVRIAVAAALAAVVGWSLVSSSGGGGETTNAPAVAKIAPPDAGPNSAGAEPVAVAAISSAEDDQPMFLAMIDDPLEGLGIDEDAWLDEAFDDEDNETSRSAAAGTWLDLGATGYEDETEQTR